MNDEAPAHRARTEGLPTLIELTDDMKQSVNGALMDRSPVIVAYTDADGQPSISFRGTVQAFSDTQLALWARNPDGGLPRALGTNPKLALLYRNMAERKGWQFQGSARITTDQAERDTIYDSSPERERDADPDRKGVAIIVDLDRVIERGQVVMER